jgi:hypothetical protein
LPCSRFLQRRKVHHPEPNLPQGNRNKSRPAPSKPKSIGPTNAGLAVLLFVAGHGERDTHLFSGSHPTFPVSYGTNTRRKPILSLRLSGLSWIQTLREVDPIFIDYPELLNFPKTLVYHRKTSRRVTPPKSAIENPPRCKFIPAGGLLEIDGLSRITKLSGKLRHITIKPPAG